MGHPEVVEAEEQRQPNAEEYDPWAPEDIFQSLPIVETSLVSDDRDWR